VTNSYIRARLRADAHHLVSRAEAESLIVHRGLRGRFRELLVDSILSPWLPPYASCGTGMIVDVEDRARQSTQEDIVVFDRSLVPPVLAHSMALEGVFPLDGVLARVEVKSKLTRAELRGAVEAAAEIYNMKFSGDDTRASSLPISTIFAFSSDLSGPADDELARLLSIVDELGLHYSGACHEVPGPIGALCIVGRGCWGYGGPPDKPGSWYQAKLADPHDEILHFVGTMSNSCFSVHQDRTGLAKDPRRGAGGGIGNFILSYDTYEKSAVQLPSMRGAG
jgi:hypothetical protein